MRTPTLHLACAYGGPMRPAREHQLPTTGGDAGPAPTAPPAREPSHAERCRTLVTGETRGALSTLAADPAGYPYGSVVSFGLADDGDPLFFVSMMAEHTQNALRDPRGQPARHRAGARRVPIRSPADGSRCSACSRRSTTTIATSRRTRYLEANPAASYYIDFGDFTFLRLTVDHIRYVGGYGRMSWVDAADYTARPSPIRSPTRRPGSSST